jgi:hypothetical protein
MVLSSQRVDGTTPDIVHQAVSEKKAAQKPRQSPIQ